MAAVKGSGSEQRGACIQPRAGTDVLAWVAERAIGTAGQGYQVRQLEPEGWEKAFEVLKDGKHCAFCSFRDTAERYIAEVTSWASSQEVSRHG